MREKTTGMTAANAMLAARAVTNDRSAVPDECNARCSKCGQGVRLQQTMLAFAAKGFVDHAKCGGQLRPFTPDSPERA